MSTRSLSTMCRLIGSNALAGSLKHPWGKARQEISLLLCAVPQGIRPTCDLCPPCSGQLSRDLIQAGLGVI